MKRWAWLVAALAGACSTAAPKDEGRTCSEDVDCLATQICSNGLCYENYLPPNEPIALDVRNDNLSPSPFRVEIRGNDIALAKVADPPPIRYFLDRADVRDRLLINLVEWQYSDLEAGKRTDGVGVATLELQQASRLGRAPFVVTGLDFPPASWDMNPEVVPPLIKSWPHYAPGAAGGDQPLYVKLAYKDDPEGVEPRWNRGIVARQLARKGLDASSDHAFEITTVRECHRKILGNIRFPEGPLSPGGLDPAPMVTVDMRHAGRVDDGDPSTPVCDPMPIGQTPATCAVETIVGQVYPTCSSSIYCPEPYGCYPAVDGGEDRCGCRLDSECPKGQVCNIEHQQCALDLTDRPAIQPVTAEPKDDAPVASAVYIYCDDEPTADRTMEFIVSTTPDARLGLPRLNYRVVLTFLVGDLLGVTPLGRVCLPTWEAAHTISLPLTGDPGPLFRVDDDVWTCCDTTCLDSDTPPSKPPSCALKPDIGVVGDFAIANPATWEAAACMPLSGADEEGRVRVTYPPAACPADSPACNVALSPGPPGGGGQDYVLRVEPPVGSMFRSTELDLTVTSDLEVADLRPLEWRFLLRGQVSQEGCGDGVCVPAAEIVAERIIRGEDPDTLLGPFFYTGNPINTFGDYVIPVNPGVYLVTALPTASANSSDTGPAPIVVVDLREGSPALLAENGMWVADIDELKLTRGEVYNIELDDFDSSSRVVPLDLTTWEDLVDPDGEPLDLSAPGTCKAGEGCQIRRLRAGGSPVRLPQDQILRFVARAAAGEASP